MNNRQELTLAVSGISNLIKRMFEIATHLFRTLIVWVRSHLS
ncbi:MAG: hypothetical protein ACI4XS_09400 [Bacillus sp. (in: firmicutes)]